MSNFSRTHQQRRDWGPMASYEVARYDFLHTPFQAWTMRVDVVDVGMMEEYYR